MSRLGSVFDRPWGGQPQEEAQLNTELLGPLIQGVICGQGPYGGAVSKLPTIFTAGRAVSAAGHSIRLSGASGHIAQPTTASSGAWSILAYGVLRGSPVSAIATTAETPGDFSQDRSMYVGSSGALLAYIYDGAVINASAGTPLVGVPFSAIVTCSSTTLRVYLNGVGGSPVATNNSGYAAYSSPELIIGYGGGSIDGANQVTTSAFDAAYVLKIERALNELQARGIGVEPWSIFQPRRAFPIYPVSAAAAGGLYRVCDLTGVGSGGARFHNPLG